MSAVIDPTAGTFADPGGILSNVSVDAGGVVSVDLTCDGTNRDGATEGGSWFLTATELAALGFGFDYTARIRAAVEVEVQSDCAHVVGALIAAGPCSVAAGAINSAQLWGLGVPNGTSVWPVGMEALGEISGGAWFSHVLGTDGAMMCRSFWDWDPDTLAYNTFGYVPEAGGFATDRFFGTGTTAAEHGFAVAVGGYTGVASGTLKFKVTLRDLSG